MNSSQETYFIIIGTDAGSGLGGISTALQGYLEVLSRCMIDHLFVPTHHPRTRFRQFWPWLRAVPVMLRHIRTTKRQGKQPILYAHLGPALSMARKFLAMLICRLWGAKIICHLHSPEIDRYLSTWHGKLFLSLCVSPADAICVLTDWWKFRVSPVIHKPIFVVPNPLNAELLKEAEKEKLDQLGESEQVAIFSMCRLVSGKGVELLVEAMRYLPENFVLRIGGDGEEKSRIAKQINESGLDERVSLLGWLGPDEKAEQFMKADLFCLPSRQDSFGMVFIEAMAYGLPIVALRFGAIPDVVPHGQAGELVVEPDPKAVAEAILKISASKIRQEMGSFGKKWVVENYGPSAFCLKIQEVTRFCLENK
jgi:glycosyltransferase involved in cell wall biosynthesis